MRGADGLKTGHTNDGGYGVVASAKVGGRRLIGVINGFRGKGHDALAAEMKKLLEYGFSTTMNKVFYQPGDIVAEIPLWYGRNATIAATVEKPFAITVAKQDGLSGVRVLARYDEPLIAPIDRGAVIGELVAEQRGVVIARAPLVAHEVGKKNRFFARVIKYIKVIFGWE